MSKVILDPILNGYNVSKINENFTKIQQQLNDNTLYRDNPAGEPNHMENDLDLNGYRILNVAKPSSPTDVVRLKDLEGFVGGDGGTIANGFIDIRDYGAIPNDTSVDNSVAILAAIQDATSTQSPVVIYGGVYYCNNFTISTTTKVTGGGTLAPLPSADDALALMTFTSNDNTIGNLTIDSKGSAVHGIRIDGENNIVNNINGKNFVGTPSCSTSASVVLITGNNNTVLNISAFDYDNGTQSNASVPRVVSVASGASYNTLANLVGKNVAAGIVFGTSHNNTLTSFDFNNSAPSAGEMRNGIYCLSGSEGNVCQAGHIESCSQPIVDAGMNNLFKDIVEVDSFSNGVQYPCTNSTFDGIVRKFSDGVTSLAGFLRTRAGNEDLAVEGVTIKNCHIDIPLNYSSFLTFDQGTVNNLVVDKNTIITRQVLDSETSRNIVIHNNGENPRYTDNTFIVRNDASAFTSDQFFIVRLPSDLTTGRWAGNVIQSEADNAYIRVTGALSKSGFYVDDTNFHRSDFGIPYLQSGVNARLLTGSVPPNSGYWRAGDVIQNTLVDLSPPVGFEYSSHLYFVCSKSGDFSDADVNNHPLFQYHINLATGTSIGNISTPTITSPLGGEEFNSSSVSITSSTFSATAGVTHASTNWQVATDTGFTSVVFESLGDTLNLEAITATGLPNPSQLYVRVQYIGNGGETSPYSTPRGFSTSAAPSADDSVGEVSTFSAVSGFHTGNVQVLWASTDNTLAYAGFQAGKVSKSTDKINFTDVAVPLNSLYSVHSIDGADDGSRVFASGSTKGSSDIGVYYSTDPSAVTPTWTKMSGLSDVGPSYKDAFTACDATGLNVFVVFGADTVDTSNVFNSMWRSTNGSALSATGSVGSAYGGVECIHVAKNAPTYFFVGTAGSATNPGRISSSSNSGTGWTHVIPPGLSVGQKIFDIESTADGQTIYAGCSGGKMYKSIDAGATFTQILTGLTIESVRSVAVSYDGKLVTFGLQSGEYIRSFDSGQNFSLTTAMSDKILAMSVNSANDLMYIGSVAGDIKKSEL